MAIVQTGAWILADASSLPAEVEQFLEAGEPPVYLGFGSMPVPEGTSRTLIEAARRAGRRAIVSRGWGELGLIDEASDCIAIGDVNQQALFPRVAAVVHHGGAGTTLAAARAGVPQVIVPMFSDQPFWASRVRELGIGTSVPMAELTVDSLALRLREALEPAIAERADSIASRILLDGAAVAARRLVNGS
jgi:vancomycin aglycone glucosyltransferase